MAKLDKDHDPAYLKALEDSLEHHTEGASRTAETYLDFPNRSDSCAVCRYHGFRYNDRGVLAKAHCSACFLKDPDGVCCVEWRRSVEALCDEDFPAFRGAETDLCDRIRRERDRVKAIQDTAKQPKTTVTVWRENYKSSYSFRGKPDIYRVVRETLEDGALAIKVMCTEQFEFCKAPSIYKGCYIWREGIGQINYCGWDCGHYDKKLSPYYGYYLPDNDINDSDIDAAVAKYTAKQPKSAHKPGEHCNLHVWSSSKDELPDSPHHFEYTGKTYYPGKTFPSGWYHDTADDDICRFDASELFACHSALHALRLVVDTPHDQSEQILPNSSASTCQ